MSTVHNNPSRNVGFRKRFLNRSNLKTPALAFGCGAGGGEHFENAAFRKRWRDNNHVIWLTKFSQKQIQNDRCLLLFQIFPAQCEGKIFDAFFEWNIRFQILAAYCEQGIKNSRLFFKQSKTKLRTGRSTFSRASCQLHVLALVLIGSLDFLCPLWLASVIIFHFGFMTRWKPLYENINLLNTSGNK